MNTLLWIQCGACGGESMAILGLDGPSERGQYTLARFLENERVRLLWHPSLSLESPRELWYIVESILCGREKLTLFCVEGSIIRGPNGTGMFDTFHGKAKKDLIAALCSKAEYCSGDGNLCGLRGNPGGGTESHGSKGNSIYDRETRRFTKPGMAI
jgi:uptake hydrogenase small subunit